MELYGRYGSRGEVCLSTIREAASVASVLWEDGIEDTGWGCLRVTQLQRPPARTAQRAGFMCGWLEGFVTAARIAQWHRIAREYLGQFTDLQPVDDFLHANMEFTAARFAAGDASPVGRQVALHVAQIDGMAAGYARAVEESGGQLEPLTLLDFWFMNSTGDLEDINADMLSSGGGDGTATPSEPSSHCSAFVALAPDNADLLFGHTMWNPYCYMLRVHKTYSFLDAHAHWSPGHPGCIFTKDCYAVASSGILMYSTYVAHPPPSPLDPETLLVWLRLAVACETADTCADFCDVYTSHHSRTYPDQVVVVDAKEFNPRAVPPLPPSACVVLEHLSEENQFREEVDLTARRPPPAAEVSSGCWLGSWNYPRIPAFIALTADVAKKSDPTRREELFAMHAPSIIDVSFTMPHEAPFMQLEQSSLCLSLLLNFRQVKTAQDFITRNEYATDPVAEGVPGVAISARWDLATGPARRLHGGYDAKVTSLDLLQQGKVRIRCGPTRGGSGRNAIPPFSWKDFDDGPAAGMGIKYPHYGHPEVFAFDWETIDLGFDIDIGAALSRSATAESKL
jgi:hypothetical protein